MVNLGLFPVFLVLPLLGFAVLSYTADVLITLAIY